MPGIINVIINAALLDFSCNSKQVMIIAPKPLAWSIELVFQHGMAIIEYFKTSPIDFSLV